MARERYLIIGDGIAGATAAETLRKKSDEAEITVLTNEGEPLYNRVQIKDFAKGTKPEDKCKIHDLKWYEDRDIALHLYTTVSMVDDKNNVVLCEDGRRFEYDKLLIAVGGTPRKYPVPNGQSEGVHTFWTFADARRIREHAQNAQNAVAVGAGLLGIDLAVIFAKNGLSTKYVMRGNRWWREGLNKEGSTIVEGYLTDLGVDCVFHETPTHFNVDDDGCVKEVVTETGEVFPADIVGAAIGLNINLRPVATSSVKTGEGILANEFLQTSVPNIYTAGDCAQYFDPMLNRIHMAGSWASAKKQGEVAATNMIDGNTTPHEFVDFYSIDHFDKPVMSVGNILGDEMVESVVQEGVYRRLIFKEKRLLGAVFVGDAKPLPFVKKIISSKEPVADRKEEMLKADFDFKGLMLEIVQKQKAKKVPGA